MIEGAAVAAVAAAAVVAIERLVRKEAGASSGAREAAEAATDEIVAGVGATCTWLVPVVNLAVRMLAEFAAEAALIM